MDANDALVTKLLHDFALAGGTVVLLSSDIQATAGALAAVFLLACGVITFYTRIQQARIAVIQRKQAEAQLELMEKGGVAHAAQVVLDAAVDTAKALLDRRLP